MGHGVGLRGDNGEEQAGTTVLGRDGDAGVYWNGGRYRDDLNLASHDWWRLFSRLLFETSVSPMKRVWGATALRRFHPLQCTSNVDLAVLRQQWHANLGNMTRELQERVPEMLSTALPLRLLSKEPEITLRLFPLQYPFVPTVWGIPAYHATMKTACFLANLMLLGTPTKLHVTSMRHESPVSDLPLLDSGPGPAPPMTPYGLYPHTDKIIVHWTSCPVGCHHLSEGSVPGGGSLAPSSLLDSTVAFSMPLSHHAMSYERVWPPHPSNTGAEGGVLFHTSLGEHQPKRVILGIFVFELTRDCTQIVVHTVENLECYEQRMPMPATPFGAF